MIEVSADRDITDFDGNTLLLGGDNNEYVFISEFEIIKFSTEFKSIDFIHICMAT